jgi:hypothetical protein
LIVMVNGRTPALRSVLPTRLVVRESSGPPRPSAGHLSDITLPEAFSAKDGSLSGAASA